MKNKEAIKEAKFDKGVEKLLLIWINENQLVSDSISETLTSEKAKQNTVEKV